MMIVYFPVYVVYFKNSVLKIIKQKPIYRIGSEEEERR